MHDVTKTLFYRKPCAPCKGCHDRNAECHSICEKYAEWSKEEKAINDKITAAKNDRDHEKRGRVKRN